MATNLTPPALQELDEHLWNSRRRTASIYRYWKMGHSSEEIATQLGDPSLSRVSESVESLKILFGRKNLPGKGGGRQEAINEADGILKSSLALSGELEEHLRTILQQAGKTNMRSQYSPPDANQLRRVTEDGGGVYIVSRKSFVRLSEATGDPLVMKLGWSTDVWDRLAGAQTWDPDPLEILRIFPCDRPNIVEAKFHICMDTLGLGYGSPGGGREWFATNLKLIDSMALSLGLSNTIDPTDLSDWNSQAC